MRYTSQQHREGVARLSTEVSDYTETTKGETYVEKEKTFIAIHFIS